MTNIFLISLLMALCCSKLIYKVTTRCPSSFERRLQNSYWSIKYCSSGNVYHCIRDEKYNLVETCNEPVLIPKGNYPKYLHKSDKIHYDKCPKHLYQPIPVWSHEISDCEYEKSSCNGIGQIPCDNGNSTDDSTCECDYQKGYVNNGYEECYCQHFTCENNLQELIAENERSPKNTCEQITFSAKSAQNEDVSTTFGPIPQGIFKRRNYSRQITYDTFDEISYSNIGIFALIVIVLLVYGTYKSTWRPYRLKISIFAGFLFFMGVFFGVHIQYNDDRRIWCAAFTLIVIIFLATICYLIRSLSVHEMITDPEVYTEEYDKRIYRLLTAASKGDIKEMRRLRYEDYINMGDTDINKRSALHIAACEGQDEVLKYIIRHDYCSLEAKDRWKRSAKDDVTWHKNHKDTKNYKNTLEILQPTGGKNDKEDRRMNNFQQEKATELITAAEMGDIRVIERLHNSRTEMNLGNTDGRTALHAAVEKERKDIVNYLIKDCHVSPFVRYRGKRPIDIALANGQDKNGKIVLQLQAEMSSLLENTTHNEEKYIHVPPSDEVMIVRLLKCASIGDIRQMRRMKASGYNMDVCNYDSQTALHIAVLENQEHIVDFLLRECKQTHIAHRKDRWNVTPWEVAEKSAMECVYNTFLHNCQELIETEHDDIKTCKLIKAAAEGDLSTLKSLHEHNVDMNQRDHGGRTALHFAAYGNNVETVKFLINEAKVDISVSDRYNRYPKDITQSEEIKDLMKVDKSNRKEGDEVLTKEHTLMQVMKASSEGILHKQKDLCFKLSKMDCCDYNGETPLHAAAKYGKLEDVQYLLDKGKACPFVRNNFGKRPIDLVKERLEQREVSIHKTKETEQYGKINKMIKDEMDNALSIVIEEDSSFVKLSNQERLILFHNKSDKGDILSIRRFLQTDSTLLNQTDYDSRSALHIAAARGHTDLVNVFIKKGANQKIKDGFNRTPLEEAAENGSDEIIRMLDI